MALQIQESGFYSLAESMMQSGNHVPWVDRLLAWQHQERRTVFGLHGVLIELEKVFHWHDIIRQRASRLVVLGIGGSSLGGQMLVKALADNGLPVQFFDNVDPDLLNGLVDIDWRQTFLLVISKSGSTVETLAQFLTVLPRVDTHRVAVITQHADSPLGRIAHESGIPIISHPPVGGRFSVLSVVGLLPLAVAGGNMERLMAGVTAMAERCQQEDLLENPAMRMAMARHQLIVAHKPISVAMTYGGRLENISHWMAQLEAESLGKKRGVDGQAVGITPVVARGVTDQHSLLQLFLDGPGDKHYTLYYDPMLEHRGEIIPEAGVDLGEARVLSGKSTGKLFAAEFFGTRDELIARGNPVRTLEIASGDAMALGEAIVLLGTEVVLLGLSLGVDPFDQPAVEAGKVRSLCYLREGQ